MVRSPSGTVDPALDAAAMLRRLGFFGLFVIVPIVAQVSRRATVVFAPISAILLIIASAIDRGNRPVRVGVARLLASPGFLAAMVVVAWSALSLVWTPFLGPATERLVNLVALLALSVAVYFALPDRMRSANLYLLPLGVAAAAGTALLIGMFGEAIRDKPDSDGALERGAVVLALLTWPAIAWLRSRGRNVESLLLAILVAVALVLAPIRTPLVAFLIGAAIFGLTSVRLGLGMRLTAAAMAGLLALAPLLPFVARPIGAAIFGPVAPGVLSLKAWQKVVTTEPIRLITGHGFETALRGRFVNLLPTNAPSTMLFEFWYELGIVGAFAAAFALYAAMRRTSQGSALIVPGAFAAFATAFAIGCIGIGLTVIWWLASLAVAVVAFVAIERGQFRSKRPGVNRLPPTLGAGGHAQG